MGGKKTTDGKKLTDIVKMAENNPRVTVTVGKRHPYLLKCDDAPNGNCALASSTSFDRHIVPWFKKLGYSKVEVYNAVKTYAWAS